MWGGRKLALGLRKPGPSAARGAVLIQCGEGEGWETAPNPKPVQSLFCLIKSFRATLAALAAECVLPRSLRGGQLNAPT